MPKRSKEPEPDTIFEMDDLDQEEPPQGTRQQEATQIDKETTTGEQQQRDERPWQQEAI
jgi:hypothetical protein